MTTALTVLTSSSAACSKTIKSFNLQKYLAQGGHEAYRKRLEHVVKLLADGVLTVPTEGAVRGYMLEYRSHIYTQQHVWNLR
jgi:hypothetical protein